MNEPLMYLISCEKSREKSRKKSREKSREKNREKNFIKARKMSGKKLKDKKKDRAQNLHGTYWAPRKFSLSFFLFLRRGFCFPRWIFDFAVSSCLFLLLLLP